jgi:hypothetical protein
MDQLFGMTRQLYCAAAFAGPAGFGGHTWRRIIASRGTHGIAHPAQDPLEFIALACSAFHVNLLGGTGEQELLNVPALGASKFVNGHCFSLSVEHPVAFMTSSPSS